MHELTLTKRLYNILLIMSISIKILFLFDKCKKRIYTISQMLGIPNFKIRRIEMKKLLLGFLSMMTLLGCQKTVEKTETTATEQTTEETSEKMNVTVTTSFLEDMTEVLAGDLVNIVLLIPAGEDPHTYESKPEDYAKLDAADLIVYHGLHFEGNLTEILEAKDAYEVTHDFNKDDLIYVVEDGESEVDPHFWFDIALYKQATNNLANKLMSVLPESKATIESNLEKYLSELDELLAYGKEKMTEIPAERRYLVTPHDAFEYFGRQYDVEVHAPQGISTDAELSTSDLAETAQFIVDHQVKAIFVESTTDPARMLKLQESVKEKGFSVEVVMDENSELFSDSLSQKGTEADTYLKMTKHNIDVIVENLK